MPMRLLPVAMAFDMAAGAKDIQPDWPRDEIPSQLPEKILPLPMIAGNNDRYLLFQRLAGPARRGIRRARVWRADNHATAIAYPSGKRRTTGSQSGTETSARFVVNTKISGWYLVIFYKTVSAGSCPESIQQMLAVEKHASGFFRKALQKARYWLILDLTVIKIAVRPKLHHRFIVG